MLFSRHISNKQVTAPLTVIRLFHGTKYMGFGILNTRSPT